MRIGSTFSAIDAQPRATGDQPFVFIYGGAFTGTAGQVRFASGRLSGDVDGDATADFEIALPGIQLLGLADLVL